LVVSVDGVNGHFALRKTLKYFNFCEVCAAANASSDFAQGAKSGPREFFAVFFWRQGNTGLLA
jgi:hypothetical protein